MRRCLLTALLASAAFAQLPPHNESGITMGHLHLMSADPAAHRKLWVDTLGAVSAKAGPLEFFRFPGVLIAVGKRETTAGTEGSVVNHLGFKVRDLKATLGKLTAAGVPIEREMPETKQAFVLFPDRIRVEFTEDAAQKEDVVHHHIHFFTNAVEEMRAWYVKTFGAKPGRRGRFEAADVPGVNLSFSPSQTATEPTRGRSVDHI
ncbi:MAG: VOC family protein, partial [Bryobacteraceae bacterium]